MRAALRGCITQSVGSIIGKRRGGRTYYYYAESGRVDGRPRIVGQRYLGTAEEVEASLGGAAAEPERTRQSSFGDVAAVWRTIRSLDLAGIVDEVIGRQRSAVSVGTHLALAVLERVVGPKSRPGELTRAPEQAWDPGRFRRAMRRLDPERRQRIEQAVSAAVRDRIGGGSALVVDVPQATIDASADGLSGSALLVSRDGAIPLSSQDHRRGGDERYAAVAGRLAERHRAGGSAEVTAVFDAGAHAGPSPEVGFVGGLLLTDHPELLAYTAGARTPVDERRLPGLTALDTRAVVDGVSRRVVLTHSETLHAAQARGFAQALNQAARRLDGLAEALAAGSYRHSRDQALAEVARITRVRWVERVLVTSLESNPMRLRWHVDEAARARVAEEFFGKQLLVTDRDGWPVAELVTAYRARYHLESTFARLAEPPAEPAEVQRMISVLAVTVLHVMRHEAEQAGLDLSVRELFEQLGGIREVVLRYPSTGGRPRTRRLLTELTEPQRRLFEVFGLAEFAPR